jgi:DNA repair protein RadC
MKYTIHYKTFEFELPDQGKIITKPEQLNELIHDDKDLDFTVENMILFGMDIKNKIYLQHLISKGSYNSMSVSPVDIMQPLIRLNLRNFILIHNHPSGVLEPSEEDLIFTKKVHKISKLLGLTLLDHIITGLDKDTFYSFKQDNLL